MSESFKQVFNKKSSQKLLLIFLALYFLLNVFQAYFTGLHSDEAYYWVYSQFLDWGYFDHPPMVAIFIKFGHALIQNTLGLRLFTISTNILAIYVLWLIVKKYTDNLKAFIILFSAVLMFQVYAFITTPDAPLFFFSVLFLYVYQIYVKEDKLKWALLLGLICAALLFSKYHGLLLIFFVLISNLKLFTRKSFYVTIILACVLFSPHVYWQFANGFPSLYYHLIDRSASPYESEYTWMYFVNQLLMMGPLVGWLFFYYGYQLKAKEDIFLRSLKFVAYGFFIFFFISTFKGEVQAHWPLIEYLALFILGCVYVGQKPELFSKFKWLFGVNILLIVLARVVLMGIIPGTKKLPFVADYHGYDVWAKQIEKVADGHPVLFLDGFQKASYYNYYTQTLNGVAYNSFYYRRTQYDLWPLEERIQNQKVLLVEPGEKQKNDQQNIETIKGVYHSTWLDSVRFYPKINFEPIDFPKEWKPNEVKEITFTMSNPYGHAVNFSDAHEKWKCSFLYGFLKEGEVFSTQEIEKSLIPKELAAKTQKTIKLKIKAPAEAGNYKLFLSVKTEPFRGTRNSKMISIKVNP